MIALGEQIIAWAEGHDAIRAVAVVGSRARRINPADEWSDLDLRIFVADPESFIANTRWLAAFGDNLVSMPLIQAEGNPAVLVLFSSGEEVDFLFFPIVELERLAGSDPLPSVYRRGYRFVVDKDGWEARIAPSPFDTPPFDKPAAAVVERIVKGFWYTAVYVAKQIRRRNLWAVKQHDWGMKKCLLKMMEWHAQASHGWQYDTWHDGRFLSRWTDGETWESLQGAFGHFDVAECWEALFATVALFRRLSSEALPHLGLAYPEAVDSQVTTLIGELRDGDTMTPVQPGSAHHHGGAPVIEARSR